MILARSYVFLFITIMSRNIYNEINKICNNNINSVMVCFNINKANAFNCGHILTEAEAKANGGELFLTN